MQVGIPVAYSVGEVKLDRTNHWICVQREGFQLRWYINVCVYTYIYIFIFGNIDPNKAYYF